MIIFNGGDWQKVGVPDAVPDQGGEKVTAPLDDTEGVIYYRLFKIAKEFTCNSSGADWSGTPNRWAIAEELAGRGLNAVGCIARELQDLKSQDLGKVNEDPVITQLLAGILTGGGAVNAGLAELATREAAAGGIAEIEEFLASLTRAGASR
jgi:hypothetical protein